MLRIGLLSTLVLAVALGGAGVASGAALAAGPDFSLSANPSSVSVPAGISPASTQVTVTPIGGFTGSVTFEVSGLPSGTTATVDPNSSGATVVFSSSGTVPFSNSTVTITGTSGSLTHTVAIQLQVVPPVSDFVISADQSTVTVTAGSGVLVQDTIRASTVTGFNGIPTFTATGLPAGVTARFQDTTPVSGGFVSALLFSADSTAASGTTPVTVTGFAGSVMSNRITISLTVVGQVGPPPDFGLSASPPSVSVQAGSTATTTITATPTPGAGAGPGPVSLSVSGLPAGVTASFSPNPITGLISTMTVTAASSASPESATITVTGTGMNSAGPIVHTVNIALTVTGGGGTGGVTLTPVVGTSGPYFNEEDLKLANTASLSSLSITIVVQRTTGLSSNGLYNTVGGPITQTSTSTASTIAYQFNLAAGSTLATGTGWTFAAQTSGSGTAHPTAGDTFTVTYTTGGTSFTQTGHF
jgi:hypothetical protein